MPTVTSFQLDHSSVCPRIRIVDPLLELDSRGRWKLKTAIQPASHDQFTISFSTSDLDVAVFQRHFNIGSQNEVLRQLVTREVPIIYDIDDDFLNIPDTHSHAEVIRGIRPNMLKLLSLSDCVTVTTEDLARLYAPYCGRIEILRNTLDPLRWTNPQRASHAGPLIIGYSGSDTHRHDLEMIEGVLIDFLDSRAGAAQLHLWGCDTPRLAAHPHVKCRRAYVGEYHEYIRSVQAETMDIALAPLTPEPFNQAKSALKWKEYAAGSIPGLFSRIPAYERVVEEGVTGMICDTLGDWRRGLETLAADRRLREKIGAEARRRMLETYTLNKAADRWEEILDSVYTGGPRTPRSGPVTSIIIPLYNRAELTEKCLEAVFRHTTGNFEVLVVDNASTDATPTMLKNWEPMIRAVRCKTNLGFAAANNLAAELAVGEILVMLNNDTEVRPGWLEALLKCHEETGAALVGSRLYYPDGSIQHAGVAFFPHDKKPHALYAGLPALHSALESMTGCRREFQCVTAACWLVTEKAWKELGGFDEGFVNGYEDVDFCLRLVEGGGRIVYEPSATVTHHESQSPGRGRHSAANEARLFERWRGKWVEDLTHYLADDRLSFDPATGYTSSRGLLETNLEALASNNPDLAQRVFQTRPGFARKRLQYLPEGPSLKVLIPGGSVLLHSMRDPVREASKLAEQAVAQQGQGEIRLFGFGLGFLAEALRARLGPSGVLRIRLEDPLVFRIALEHRDLAALLRDSRVTFDQGLNPQEAFWLPALRSLKG